MSFPVSNVSAQQTNITDYEGVSLSLQTESSRFWEHQKIPVMGHVYDENGNPLETKVSIHVTGNV